MYTMNIMAPMHNSSVTL